MKEHGLARAVTAGDWHEVGRVLDDGFFYFLLTAPDLLDSVFAAAEPGWYHEQPRHVMSRALAVAARQPVPLVDARALERFTAWVRSQARPALRDVLLVHMAGMRELLATGRFRDAAAMADDTVRLVDTAADMAGFPDVLPAVLLCCGNAKLLVGAIEDAIGVYAEAVRWATIQFEHPWARYARGHLALAYALAERYKQACELLHEGDVEPMGPGTARFHYQQPASLAFALIECGTGRGTSAEAAVRLPGISAGAWWWVPVHMRALGAVLQGTQLDAIHEISQSLLSERVRSNPSSLAGAVLRADLATLQQSMGKLNHAHRVLTSPVLSSTWSGTRVARARQEWLRGNPDGALAMLRRDESQVGLLLAHEAKRAILYAEAELATAGTINDRSVEAVAFALNTTHAILGVTQASPALRRRLEPLVEPLLGPSVQMVPVRFVPRPRPRLTRREQDVLRALVGNASIAELAVELHISPNTVKSHLRGLYRKLGAHSREEALSITHESG